jgi:hypothetical protein
LQLALQLSFETVKEMDDKISFRKNNNICLLRLFTALIKSGEIKVLR